jgi:hypothetical protein
MTKDDIIQLAQLQERIDFLCDNLNKLKEIIFWSEDQEIRYSEKTEKSPPFTRIHRANYSVELNKKIFSSDEIFDLYQQKIETEIGKLVEQRNNLMVIDKSTQPKIFDSDSAGHA